MVILGLGSNVGDRLHYLHEALKHIQTIPDMTVAQVSPVYISDALLPENAPAAWDAPYLNLAIRCETTLKPHDLLHYTKNIEAVIGRVSGQDWGPRPIDIDILAWDNLILYDEKLHIPHEHLHTRPFALWPLADVAPEWIYPLENQLHGKSAAEIVRQWGSRFNGDAPLHTRQILQRIDTAELMGIINVTPDSFSDGGTLIDVQSAMQHAYSLVDAGANLLDIGAEATGPHAKPLDAKTEWQRLEPILAGILAEKKYMLIPPKISIDTRHAATARPAVDVGVDWSNDVSGLSDPLMQEIIKNSASDVVIMHQLGIPENNNIHLPLNQDPVTCVYDWAEAQLEFLHQQGINSERVIVDIGIGFGKTAEQSMRLLQHISQFKKLGTRLLVGHSRKSFLKLFTDKSAPQRDIETLPVSLYLSRLGVDYLRLHNVELTARALRVGAVFGAVSL
jgi:2-amino-4-hydroxy-6-hydroxymethyldihydropteridine diphosphokinase/dihydropteroate synthase